MKKTFLFLFSFVVPFTLLTTPVYATVTASYSSASKTLTISGEGAMTTSLTTSTDWTNSYKTLATTVFIENGVTAINNEAFKGFSKVTSVSIANSVQSIGHSAFSGCTKLESIAIPEGITTIEHQTFYNCSTMVSITLPSTVRTIGYGAFYQCKAMAEIHASTPDDWAQIVFQSHDGTTADKAHPFNASTASTRQFIFTQINDVANNDLKKEAGTLIFTPTITKINKYAFYKATNIKYVNIPGTVTEIEDHAFDCNITRLVVNKKNPPISYTNSFSFTTATTSTYLYIPTGASTSYVAKPWYDSDGNGGGANKIGYNDTNTTRDNNFNNTSGMYSHHVTGDYSNIHWELQENGSLVFTGYGTLSSLFNVTNNNTNVLPWFRFRYLVHKIIIRGSDIEIGDLGNFLQFSYGLKVVDIDQTERMPTFSITSRPGSYFSSDKIKVNVPVSVFLSENKGRPNLSSKWNEDYMDVELVGNVILNDNENNTATLTALQNLIDSPFSIRLSRTLRNVSFNSFCSPVDMSAEQVTDIFGAGTEIYTLVSSSYDPIANELALNLSENQTAIEAGKPYVIKPANDAPTITIADVAPSTVATAAQTIETDVMDFHGLLNPYTLSSGDKFLVVSANNELNWTESGTLKGMRSYFTLKPSVPAQAMAAKARLVFADESPEAITNIEVEQPVQKIMRNGQLLIVRDGVTYNTMGQIVE